MQEVFEKIIEELEELHERYVNQYGVVGGNPMAFAVRECIDIVEEIVKQEAAECKRGHFGCNSNGQHEKCSACCDYDCKNRNREWFGAKDDITTAGSSATSACPKFRKKQTMMNVLNLM